MTTIQYKQGRAPSLSAKDAYDDQNEYERKRSKYPVMEYNTYLGFIPRASHIGDGYITNCHHFRHHSDFPEEKEKDEIRIFITGGSKAWGAGATQEKLYTRIIEKLLRENNSGLNIRVVCAAVNTYCSVQERIMIENRIIRFSPDYIVMFSGRNDCYFGYTGRDIMHDQDYFNYRDIIEGDTASTLRHLISKLLYGHNKGGANTLRIDKSIKCEKVVGTLMTNLHILGNLAERCNFKLIFYLEPTLYTTRKQFSSWERLLLKKSETKFAGFSEYSRMVYSMYRDTLPNDAKRNGYVFVDGDKAIENEERSIFSDHVHFGDRAYRLVANHLSAELRTHMREVNKQLSSLSMNDIVRLP
jgi:hypothetical protein